MNSYNKLNVYRFLASKKTSAHIIAKEFARRGISSLEIGSNHLVNFYDSLQKISNTSFADPGSRIEHSEKETITEEHDRWGVIVETREHPLLEKVVENVIANLKIPVQIFHGNKNYNYIRKGRLNRFIDAGVVSLRKINIDSLSRTDYNALLMSPRFWYSIGGRGKILVFQTDSIICSNSPYSLNDFRSFDYIGSNWNRERPVGLIIDGGCGGLSFRDWASSVSCLRRFDPELWPGGEDSYFAFHMELMDLKVATYNDCAKFSTQHSFIYRSLGAHKYCALPGRAFKRFAEYCPEIKEYGALYSRTNT